MINNELKLQQYLEQLKKTGDIIYETDASLKNISTFGIGGNAKCIVKPENISAFCNVVRFCKNNSVNYTVIGNGSNVLFDDLGYNGVIILTTLLSSIAKQGNILIAECGSPLTYLSVFAMKENLSGLTFAYGIPGTVGGAVFMNAGAYGGEIKDVVTEVEWYDTKSGTLGKYVGDDNCFGYRSSIYQSEDKIILSATFDLKKGVKEDIKSEMDDYMQRRKSKQPLEFPSAGSTFKRYPGYFTGKLIEDAGLKGYSVGDAQVSEKHAGFVINRGNATCKDVLTLIDFIKNKIYEINGINIECEVRYIPYEE